MGQKVNPIGFRLAVDKDWRSKWYAPEEEFADQLHEDLKIRKYLKGRLQMSALSKILIERAWNSVRVTLFTSRPGLVIGRKGAEIEKMTADLSKMCGNSSVKIDIFEIKQPELDAQLVAESVAVQLERRISFRRAMKRAVQTTMEFGAEGVRLRCAGRLGGADIARAEWYRKGKVPLQTLRVPLDYGFAEARTTWGIIGVKCWLNKKPESEGGPSAIENQKRRENNRNNRRGGGGNRDNRGGGGPRRDDNNTPAPAAETPAAVAAPAPEAAKSE